MPFKQKEFLRTEHEEIWKEKRYRKGDLLSILEKLIVPMTRLHFPETYSGACMTLPTYISRYKCGLRKKFYSPTITMP